MRFPFRINLAWDLIIFLGLTVVGFVFSMQRLVGSGKSEAALRPNVPIEGTLLTQSNPIFDLGCVDTANSRVPRATSRDGAIRLRGRLCTISTKALRKISDLRIRNVTTGNEATVFSPSRDGSFVTDFLLLESGSNLLEVQWKRSPTERSVSSVRAEVFQK